MIDFNRIEIEQADSISKEKLYKSLIGSYNYPVYRQATVEHLKYLVQCWSQIQFN